MRGNAASPIQEEVLSRARGSFIAAQAGDLRALIDRKRDDLGHYNVAAMDRVVAICYWGRSGSLLLASYLDGHDNVVMLPTNRSQSIYNFFEQHPSLCLWDKLVAYPFFISESASFFAGDFPISPADYYAAVSAIFETFNNWPPELLESRRVFFQLIHVAYSVARGQRPATPQPIMVYAQHRWEEKKASYLVEDFPEALFIHTVRDPIAAFDRLFDRWFRWYGEDREAVLRRSWAVPFPGTAPLIVTRDLLGKADCPHPGLESRTRAIRFEDLHDDIAGTMGRLVAWIGLPFRTSLLESTFNGRPYVVERKGQVWSGQQPEQAKRHSQNISITDRALIFALMYDNFATWNYPCPRIFRNPLVRGVTCMLLLLVPMKMEIIIASAVIRLQVLPSLRSGDIRFALGRSLRIVYCRLGIMYVVASECFQRLWAKKTLLRPL
jgi:hypothetical protein